MDRKLLINEQLLTIIIRRLCEQLLENHGDFSNTVLIGLQPKGIFLAQKIQQQLLQIIQKEVPLGYLDVTFFRDDFRRRDGIVKANATKIDFVIEGKMVILIDDVLYTGRTVRSALDAMTAYGRPLNVELLVLIDRRYSRDLPIEANYIGKQVDSIHSQRVSVELKEQGFEQDTIWIVDK
ncbi:MAG: bifunctional pyr operon transcriptional regulator/uracil phosphoribosyltransferase PyrR [Cytophagales bacterium]|nr:MAG: bifunctional pyr operon transcriptional regulator/uracil phosphoribosyltransferase PyrR [Cytophagales bacterium]